MISRCDNPSRAMLIRHFKSTVTSALLQALQRCFCNRIQAKFICSRPLPNAWPNGSVKGMHARGGFEVDMACKDGKLATAVIRSFIGANCRVRYGDQAIVLHLKPGAAVRLNESLSKPSVKITQPKKELWWWRMVILLIGLSSRQPKNENIGLIGF
jgi:hypothetical protein